MCDEILKQRVDELTAQLNDAKREISALKHELDKPQMVVKHPGWACYQPHRAYLESKVRRQSEAIRKIQKVGWQPTFIIHEVPYPDDAHLWLTSRETDVRPKKARVQNRYPER